MTARDTSIEAYNHIIKSDYLKNMHRIVYKSLFNSGPCTASELFHQMVLPDKSLTHSNIRARLGELRDMGIVKEVQKRKCQITERKVLVWYITNEDTPIVLKKKTTLKKLKEIEIYCEKHKEYMFAATILGIIKDCDFKDT